MDKLYLYRYRLQGADSKDGLNTTVLDGEREFVEKFVNKSEFPELFGGYILSTDKEGSPFPISYIGVWGSRIIQKFKRTLRERGAVFEVCKINASERFVKLTSRHYEKK